MKQPGEIKMKGQWREKSPLCCASSIYFRKKYQNSKILFSPGGAINRSKVGDLYAGVPPNIPSPPPSHLLSITECAPPPSLPVVRPSPLPVSPSPFLPLNSPLPAPQRPKKYSVCARLRHPLRHPSPIAASPRSEEFAFGDILPPTKSDRRRSPWRSHTNVVTHVSLIKRHLSDLFEFKQRSASSPARPYAPTEAVQSGKAHGGRRTHCRSDTSVQIFH